MAEKHHECDCEHEHNHECDCGCEHDHDCDCEEDLVILNDDNGNEIPFHFVYELEHEGKLYAFLQRADGEEEMEIFEVQFSDDEETSMLYPVDDALYDVLYEKLLLVASEDCCEDEDCDCHHHHDEDDK